MTGTDALQHALSESYDLLILDVMMPGLDGWEVLRMVRATGKDHTEHARKLPLVKQHVYRARLLASLSATRHPDVSSPHLK